jgi:hypothetical protein
LYWVILPLAVILLLAVGSDYNLLLVSRFKEEIHAGINTGIIRSMAGSGSVVTVAGLMFTFTMASFIFSDLLVLGQIGTTLPNSYYWFGQQPNGAVFFHPLGLRYAPMSVWINASGDLMGRGAWSSYPQIRKDEGFAELASFVGQDHLGSASGFPIAEHDVEKLWAHILGCAQKINRTS